MAWRLPGDKPLSDDKPMMIIFLTHICFTRPQWIKLPINRNVSIFSHVVGNMKYFVPTKLSQKNPRKRPLLLTWINFLSYAFPNPMIWQTGRHFNDHTNSWPVTSQAISANSSYRPKMTFKTLLPKMIKFDKKKKKYLHRPWDSHSFQIQLRNRSSLITLVETRWEKS